MISAHQVVRRILGIATLASAGLGLVLQEPRWFAFSGLVGTVWWLWDVLMERFFEPLGHALARLLHGDIALPNPNLRPTAHDTIRLLENRLENAVSRQADLQVAQRLADLYRAVLKDSVRAEAVMRLVETRYGKDADRADRADRGG